jgi:hypothetical protein
LPSITASDRLTVLRERQVKPSSLNSFQRSFELAKPGAPSPGEKAVSVVAACSTRAARGSDILAPCVRRQIPTADDPTAKLNDGKSGGSADCCKSQFQPTARMVLRIKEALPLDPPVFS